MLVCTDNRAIDHHISIVVIDGQIPENPFGHAAFVPATQSTVGVLPVPEPDRQITSGNAGTVAIQNRFHN